MDDPNKAEVVKEHKRKSCLEKYGVDNPNKIPEVREKIRKTCYERFGQYWNHQYDRYCYDGKVFDSSWELKYYTYLKKSGKNFKYHPNLGIKYIGEDGKEHLYEPDFLIDGKIFEIKGDHFFKEGVLVNPYDNFKPQIKKQECMKKNNVIILKQKDLKEAFEFFDKEGYLLEDYKIER